MASDVAPKALQKSILDAWVDHLLGEEEGMKRPSTSVPREVDTSDILSALVSVQSTINNPAAASSTARNLQTVLRLLARDGWKFSRDFLRNLFWEVHELVGVVGNEIWRDAPGSPGERLMIIFSQIEKLIHDLIDLSNLSPDERRRIASIRKPLETAIFERTEAPPLPPFPPRPAEIRRLIRHLPQPPGPRRPSPGSVDSLLFRPSPGRSRASMPSPPPLERDESSMDRRVDYLFGDEPI